MSKRFELINLLADGQFRSGEWLGRRLGVSRAAVWKQVQALADLGLDVHAVRGQGYRLAEPFQPLDDKLIRHALTDATLARLRRLDVFPDIDSTSSHLKRVRAPGIDDRFDVCLAESQSEGRGRRGRRWVSPYGASLYLSLGTFLGEAALGAGGLSLAAAVGVAQALGHCGVGELGLKWPNDIFYQGRKLAGILLDLSGESGGPYHVVIGVGINFRVPQNAAQAIDQPWADLSQTGVTVERNRLAGLIVGSLVNAIDLFNRNGLNAFANEWKRYDLASGRAVELHHGQESMITGVARGIDSHGALLIEHNGVTRSYHAGEVSLRLS